MDCILSTENAVLCDSRVDSSVSCSELRLRLGEAAVPHARHQMSCHRVQGRGRGRCHRLDTLSAIATSQLGRHRSFAGTRAVQGQRGATGTDIYQDLQIDDENDRLRRSTARGVVNDSEIRKAPIDRRSSPCADLRPAIDRRLQPVDDSLSAREIQCSSFHHYLYTVADKT